MAITNTASDFLERHPGIESINLLIGDLNGILRGKRIGRDVLAKVFQQGFALPASVMGMSARGITVEDTNLGLNTGEPDYLCRVIPGTLSQQPWQKQGAQVLCTMHETDGTAFYGDPRQALVRVVERFEQLGYGVGIALELEFYLIDQQRDHNGRPQPPVTPSGRRVNATQVYSMDDLDDNSIFIDAVLSAAEQQNIPADTVITENAPGQFEVNLDYGADILAAADHAVLLKRVIRCVAKSQGMEATFMAKPFIDLPGSGLHIHLSLLDQAGNNVLASADPEQHPLLRQAIAGLLTMADSTQALVCPTVNSFRRLAPSACVPTNKTWGYDNRSVAMRIPAGPAAATRIESRTAGADANPYLATAAMLIGVTEGITGQLTPPDPVRGNAYEQCHPRLPDNQRDALRAMAAEPRIAQWLGEDFIKLYSCVKWHDLQLFEAQITPLEEQLLMPYV